MNYTFNWQMIFSGQYLDWILEGFRLSISLMVVSSIIAVIVGIAFTFLSLSRHRALRFVSQAYIELCRNIPTLVWIFFFFFVFPAFFPQEVSKVINSWPYLSYWAAVAGLALSSSGYISEILRGGVQAVHKEQTSAAYSLGLSKAQMWCYVIGPQAVRNCYPALVNRIIHNVQNTSLAMTISVHEIMWATQQIEAITFHGIETMIIATVFFVLMCFFLEFLAKLLEKRLMPVAAA